MSRLIIVRYLCTTTQKTSVIKVVQGRLTIEKAHVSFFFIVNKESGWIFLITITIVSSKNCGIKKLVKKFLNAHPENFFDDLKKSFLLRFKKKFFLYSLTISLF